MAESLRLLERAAALGHGPSKTQLGLIYQTGKARPKDPNRAYLLFRDAAAAGDAEGQFRLAMSLTHALGTPANPPEARRWLASAANLGHQEAQFALGVMLQQGIGGAKNEFAARRWLRAALAGSDSTIVAEAKPLVQRLEERLLYRGMTAEQVVGTVVVVAAAFAIAARYFGDGDGQSAFGTNPNHPLNPHNYDAFGTTRRRERCRFVSRSSGMDILRGRGAMFYGSGNVWTCSYD